MITILDDLRQAVADYGDHGSTASINLLLDLQDKVVTICFTLAEQMASTKDDYNRAYFQRKITIIKRTNALMRDQKIAKNKAESFAIEEAEDIEFNELDLESTAYRLEVLLRQGNRVADAIRSRISYLKKEQDNLI